MAENAAMERIDLAQDLAREAFWRAHFPTLTLAGDPPSRDAFATATDPQVLALLEARMLEEGYFQHRSDTIGALAPKISDAVRSCVRLGIPPPFLFLFDEAWACFQSLHPVLRGFLGDDYRMLPDFWVWHVDPQADEAGWPPHRDKGMRSLSFDGHPLSLTVWAPLVDATPLTSCMYLLPANKDPNYNTPEEDVFLINVPSVRALPGRPGDVFCWNQAVLHWGSESSRFAPHARISIALEFQRGDIAPFNEPLLSPFVPLDFSDRLKLVAKQILQYKHMYPLAARFESLAQRLLAV